MYPNNESKAQSFDLQTEYPQIKFNHVEFLANINTSAQVDRPFYSQPVFGAIKEDQSEMYLALRAQSKIAILQISFNKIDLKHQMEFSENFIRKHKVSCFEFVKTPITKYTDKLILIGFRTGLIHLMDFSTDQFIDNYNIKDEKGFEPWKFQSVTKIINLQYKQQFLVLFQDSTVIKYGLTNTQKNFQILDEISKIEQQLQFDKNIQQYPVKRKKYENSQLEIGSIQSEQLFQCLSIYSMQENKDILSYTKFNINSIIDMIALVPEHYFYKFVNANQYEPLIVMITDFDGYLRVVDIHNLIPIYLFKSNYGGINSVVCENDRSPIFAIGCQDDSTIILNVETNFYFRILGQNSFVSRSTFLQTEEENLLRIISSSYDGSISIMDIEKNHLNQLHPDQNQKLPMKIYFDKNSQNCKHLQLQKERIKDVNKQGLGFLEICGKVIVTSSFDGCSSVWQFMELSPQQINEQQLKQKQQSQNSSIIKNEVNQTSTIKPKQQ